MKRWVLLWGALMVAGNLSAQFAKVGTAGAQFLKIGIDPKGTGMGEAYTALAKGPFAVHWNPAGLASVKQQEVSFSDVEWFAGVRNNFLGYIIPGALMGTVGMSISALTSSQEEVTTEQNPNGIPGLTWSYTAIACGISYARMMTDKFAFGMNVRYLQERIWDVASQGISTDLGICFNPGYWGPLRFGFVIKNFGPDMCYGGGHLIRKQREEGTPSGISPVEIELKATPYPLPLCFKLGAGYDIIDMPTNRLTAAFDLSSPNDGAEKVHFGIEDCIMQMFSLRVGYTYDPDAWDDRKSATERWSGGVGITYPLGVKPFAVNYAIQDMGYLGLSHRIAVDLEL